MRASPVCLLTAALLFCAGAPAEGQGTSGKLTTIVFKDGYVLASGKVKRPTTWFSDPNGGSFTVPVEGSYYTWDDNVRSIAFSPRHVQDIIEDKVASKSTEVRLVHRGPRTLGDDMEKSWEIEDVSPWDNRWERVVKISTKRGWTNIPQRLVLMTPKFYRVDALKHNWTAYYFTRELGPDLATSLVYKHMALTGEPAKEIDRRLQVYHFLLQAGWTDHAETELGKIVRAYPREEKRLKPVQQALEKLLNVEFVDSIERRHKAGQHQEAQDRLQRFDDLNIGDNVTEKAVLRVQELKNKYEEQAAKIKAARRFLKGLPEQAPPMRRELYDEISAAILGELTFDTLGRLETFLSQAQDWERSLKNKKAPAQTPEELLAFAVSGWLLGDGSAEKSTDFARKLWAARQLVLEAQKADAAGRRRAAAAYDHDKGVPLDVIARMIPNLPPSEPHEKLGTEPIKLDAGGAAYHVILPPEYHHGRAYPVLVVLHHSQEKPADSLKRWTELAAQRGYILAAPAWAGKGLKATYQYSAKEHGVVLDMLRDLRQRFQIDSDRVYLFGCEQGGHMAWDVGLSHPDQFAAVMPMSAPPRYHGFRYWTNAQYLPFYIVNGERTGKILTDTRQQFKNWIRYGYPAWHVEYKGRAAEWFEAETETLADWMGRKKRSDPAKELGKEGHEFRTMRETDNRFYWVGFGQVAARYLNGVGNAWNPQTAPAWVYAAVFAQNQINVRAGGVGQISLWLGPGMINFKDKLTLNVNGGVQIRTVTPSLETLLEELARTGDRQRLVWARVDLK